MTPRNLTWLHWVSVTLQILSCHRVGDVGTHTAILVDAQPWKCETWRLSGDPLINGEHELVDKYFLPLSLEQPIRRCSLHTPHGRCPLGWIPGYQLDKLSVNWSSLLPSFTITNHLFLLLRIHTPNKWPAPKPFSQALVFGDTPTKTLFLVFLSVWTWPNTPPHSNSLSIKMTA